MERTTVTFYDEIYDYLKNRAKKQGNQSIAQAIRELVDLGIKVEKASESQHTNNKDSLQYLMENFKEMLKLNMHWTLETMLLSRVLVTHHDGFSEDQKHQALVSSKEKAELHIKEKMGEMDEKS